MSRFTLTEVTPSVPEGLRCRFLLADRAQTQRMTVLVVAFEGDYPDGSLGNNHGAFIATRTLHGLHAFCADCVVLDFRAMTYRWGNTLLQVFQDVSQFMDSDGEPGAPPFPVLAVTSEKSRAAFLGLVTPHGRPVPPWHFDDIDAAIACGSRKAEEWLAS
ncbi:hypothetical protein SAMN05216567_108160 [Variovorax sp. OK605]|uniref:hypothetical protein n=1 Tax=Variovorax sp. OK605 TaxID=1855317 RepID=UPI0008E76BD5|nr:hypothetical protein [Variovorax sp. OK605]SFP72490.1 hypothetical protein SAMN05216567_108160 [Variovorax sp. OK605]